MAQCDSKMYNVAIEELRHREYPMLKDSIYLDHAGTTLYAKSLIERFSADMVGNLYGNPHSASNSSQLTTRRIEDVRLSLLRLFNADPEEFDLVFVANATAGIKLVVEAFREQEKGFWFGYHRDAHTSVIGARELADDHRCFASDSEVNAWIDNPAKSSLPGLFAYPAQSNMNGRRLPLNWPHSIRSSKGGTTYTLLDAAALVSTSPLDLGQCDEAPDFVVLSLYKMFGFPNLGALIVRKSSASIFDRRRYFGGGTVEMVVCLKEQWHASKSEVLHERLEDGTLPIHSILALGHAIAVHQELFGSFEAISTHTTALAARLYDGLSSLRHANGERVCQIYKDPTSSYGDPGLQGPIVAFNIRNHLGAWVSNAEVEKIASVKNIHIRTGGLCNPGGVAAFLELAPWEMRDNFSAGQRCGNDNDVIRAKPTGMIRVSVGAMSTIQDVTSFVDFMQEFFVHSGPLTPTLPVAYSQGEPPTQGNMHVESIAVYPLKSCAAWYVPPGQKWEIRPEGLAWDREWCLLHQGTGVALSQKRYPKMALIRPSIDLDEGVLRVRLEGTLGDEAPKKEITVPLSANPRLFSDNAIYRESDAKVCGEPITAKAYKSADITAFFTKALGVACHLARFPPGGNVVGSMAPSRHSKAHLQMHRKAKTLHVPGAFPDTGPLAPITAALNPILLSNESPILTISRSSLNRLNEQVKNEGGKAVQADVFRANIVVAESLDCLPGAEQPYAEDQWRYMQIGRELFEMLGPCRRCQMVCINQQTAERNQEPFVTLSKTRRVDGRVYFGVHTSHLQRPEGRSPLAQYPTISVNDTVRAVDVAAVQDSGYGLP